MTNVLVDRHQADLFYSLQLLGDRLGWTVYTPIGHEWWDEGYWEFGKGTYPDDRLARQFLSTDGWHWTTALADPTDHQWQTWDGHHPERLIRGITLAGARAVIDWDYVIATVQDNQYGFARFAQERSARYVLQVGNTNAYVDWSLDPLALVSSEVPIKGRGVLYHQEFDSEGTFGFRRLPQHAGVIRSFVNCFPDTTCWRTFGEVREALTEFLFGVYGIDGPDGNIAPVSEIARLMAGSGWAWHDKPQGDGFGHVIHNWAAVGRPLVGHGMHYRGLMAASFWSDETAIDLDLYAADEAAETIREITADRKRHQQMGRAIRERFDSLVDWDAEAETIRAFLA